MSLSPVVQFFGVCLCDGDIHGISSSTFNLDFSLQVSHMSESSRSCCALTTAVALLSSGWNKASLSLDASEENDGYSSAEEPLNSDPEDDSGKKLVSHCVRSERQPQSVY